MQTKAGKKKEDVYYFAEIILQYPTVIRRLIVILVNNICFNKSRNMYWFITRNNMVQARGRQRRHDVSGNVGIHMRMLFDDDSAITSEVHNEIFHHCFYEEVEYIRQSSSEQINERFSAKVIKEEEADNDIEDTGEVVSFKVDVGADRTTKVIIPGEAGVELDRLMDEGQRAMSAANRVVLGSGASGGFVFETVETTSMSDVPSIGPGVGIPDFNPLGD